jgi:hypothetical protein
MSNQQRRRSAPCQIAEFLERQVHVIRMLHIGVTKVAYVMITLRAIFSRAGPQRILDHRTFAVRAGERRMLEQFSFAGHSRVKAAEARNVLGQTWTRAMVDYQISAFVLALRIPCHHITIAPLRLGVRDMMAA